MAVTEHLGSIIGIDILRYYKILKDILRPDRKVDFYLIGNFEIKFRINLCPR
jgi:hypothetical protein